MKLRNFLIVLFAVLMVFAFASCKNEPKEEPKPTPKPQPVIPDYYQIEVTEGVDKDYWNRDKIKLEWDEEINSGDVLSLKYRSERDVYQWDIRNKSVAFWVYETQKGTFSDPVLGDDGWYTLTYTFGQGVDKSGTITGTKGSLVDIEYPQDYLCVYFRGNYVTTDLFEIKDVTLNGEPLEITQDNIKSYSVLNGTEENPIVEHDWSVKNWSVLFATGQVGEVDKTPLAEKVLDGGLVTGAPVAKEGYTLSIFTNAERTIPFDATQPIHEEKIFYYQYVGIPRTITFELNGGAFEEGAEVPATVPNGDMLPEIPEPVLATKAFKAWYKDEGLTEAWVMTDPVLGDMTLYAAYGDPATVTFQANNGEEPATKIVAIGNPVKMPETPTNGSKMFLGWYSDAECTVAYDFSAPVTADITVYAAWVNATDVTLNLNYEGAPAATTFKAALDEALAVDNENLIVSNNRIAYFFDGWYKDAACETAYDYTEDVLTGPITLYAKWRTGKIAQIVSTYNRADNKDNCDKFRVKFQSGDYKTIVKGGDVLTFRFRSTTPITHFNVRGDKKWIYQQKFNADYVTSYVVGEDGWIYVTYTFPLADGTNSFDDGQGKIPADFYDTDRTFYFDFISYTIVINDIVEVQGMALNGKELTIDSGNVTSGDSSIKPTVGSVAEEYAWAKQNVTFNTGVADAIAPAEVDFGGRAVRPAEDPAKEGYHFDNWYADDGFTKVFDFENTPITKATTIYAKIGVAKTVTFNSNEGSAVAAVELVSGDKVAKPVDPVKEGSVFMGWYSESTFENEYNFDTPVTEDITLYAKWLASAKLTYNLNYDGAPAAQVADVEKNAALTAPGTPARAGYFFGGWFKEAGCENEFDFAEGVAADTTIYAKWNAPTKSYKYTAIADQSGDRFQFGWKVSKVSFLTGFKAGDTITFMVKGAGAGEVRIRDFDTNGDIAPAKYTALPAADESGWKTVTITFTSDNKSYTGICMGIYPTGHAGGSVTEGAVLEIKALAFNGVEIPIVDGDSECGLYPSGTNGQYGVGASLEIINL